MNYKRIQNSFPTEIDLCGLIKFGTCTDSAAHLTEIIADVECTDNPILLTRNEGELKAFFFKNGKLEETTYEVIDAEELSRDFSFVRLRFDLREYVEDLNCIPAIMQDRRKYVRKAIPHFNVVHFSNYSSFSWPLDVCVSGSRTQTLC